MADTVVTLTGDDAQLFKAIQRLVDQQAKLDGAFKKTKDSSKAAGDQAKKSAGEAEKANSGWASSIDSVGKNVLGMATGYLSVQTAMTAVSSVMAEQVKMQKESYELAMNVAKTQQEAVKNFTGLSTPEISALTNIIAPEIAVKAGFPDIAKITEAMGGTFSAGADIPDLIKATTAGAMMTRLTPDALPATAAAAVDLTKGTGFNSASANLAFLFSAGKAARVDDPAKFAELLATVVKSGVNMAPEQDREKAAIEIAAVFNALNQMSNDKRGASTDTATTQFLGELRTFFKDRADDPKGIMARIEKLQNDPETRKAFQERTFGEQRFKIGFETLADAKSEASQMMRSSKSEITFDEKVFAQKVEEEQSGSKQLAIASGQTTLKAAIEVKKLKDPLAEAYAISKLKNDALEASAINAYTTAGNLVNYVDFMDIGYGATFRANKYTTMLKTRLEYLKKQPKSESTDYAIVVVETAIREIAGTLQKAKKSQQQAEIGKKLIDKQVAEKDQQLAVEMEERNKRKQNVQTVEVTKPPVESKKAAEESKLEELRQQTETMLWAVKNLQYSFEDMTRSSRKVGTELERGARAAKTSAQKQAALRANAGGE